MNHSTLRDFFLVPPMIYEAVGRLAIQNFKPAQMVQLKDCQERFRSAISGRNAEAMVVENNRFHALIGEMADSAYLKPSLNKLLIDHARIGYTFFRPTTDEMESNLAESCAHHDQMIQAIAEKDEAAIVRLVLDHWELSRRNMEMFIAPRGLKSEVLQLLSSEPTVRRSKTRKVA
jgi:DNA-binding GntR family transcriptional regulator